MHYKISQFQKGNLELFDTIAIETSEFCNRTCSFCPNSIHTQQRRLMSVALYTQIVQQLAEIKFEGTICFNQYNEPLLDKRLDQFLTIARLLLPKVRLTISTNGDALTLKRWISLRNSGLNFAVISQYDGFITPKIQKLMAYETDANSYKVEIRSAENLKSNRCGSVNLDQTVLPLRENCLRPFSQLIIRYTGLVVLCCEDYFSAEIIGDINMDTISAVWNSTKLNKIRSCLINKERKGICAKCNVTYLSTVDSCEFIRSK